MHYPFPVHPTFCLFFSPIKSNLCCLYILKCVAFLWSVINSFSFSQDPSVINTSSIRGETSHPPLLSMLGFGLTWAYTSLVHAATIPVGSYVRLPFCVQMTLRNYLFIFLIIFPGRCRHIAPISFTRMSIFGGDPLKLIHVEKLVKYIIDIFIAHVEIYSPTYLLLNLYTVEKCFQILSQSLDISYDEWLTVKESTWWPHPMLSTNQQNYGFWNT